MVTHGRDRETSVRIGHVRTAVEEGRVDALGSFCTACPVLLTYQWMEDGEEIDGASDAAGEDVVDADFEEVSDDDDEKKSA